MFKVEYKRDKLFKSKEILFENIIKGNGKIYIFGLTGYAKTIYNFFNERDIKILGFIDNITNNEEFLGEKVFRLNEVEDDAYIIISVIEGRPKTIYNLLLRSGYKNIIDYFDFNFVFPKEFPIPFNDNNYQLIFNHFNELEFVYNKLVDDTSRKMFLDIIDFRLNFNYYDHSFIFIPEQQYFEPFFPFENIRVFVDAGGYDGLTTLKAIKSFHNLEKVYYIEPFPASMIKSKEILSKVNTCEIFYIDSAISSDNLLKFITDDKGSANHLLDNGNVEVKVSTLDNLVDENVDYIKLDIEGEELNAIIGSNRIIKECKPFLAVCIYHNQSHFWQIPISILNINPYYRIYLRHYTEGIFETVMYFI